MAYIPLIAIGLVAGVAAGMFGIGGGLIIVPALMYIMKFNPLQAVGTSLWVILLPTVLLGAIEHYKAGNVNLRSVGLIAVGLFVGSYFGAKIMLSLPQTTARRVYAVFLLIIGLRWLIIGK